MKVIKKVPVNTGIDPNAPELPTWSSLIAICGLQWNPNIKSKKDICLKNLKLSKNKDRIIPTVVKTATIEQINKKNLINFSTFCLAGNSILIFLWKKINNIAYKQVHIKKTEALYMEINSLYFSDASINFSSVLKASALPDAIIFIWL